MLLYAIANRASFPAGEADSARKLIDLSAMWASQGVNFIQLREENATRADFLPLAAQIVEAVRQPGCGTCVIVNAGIERSTAVALESGADGVHVPGGFAPGDLAGTIAGIRSRWANHRDPRNRSGANRPVISIACHAAAEVRAAREAGASLALFAPVFEKTLPGQASLPGKGLAALAEACRAGREPAPRPALPVLALGGVTLANAAQCVAAGAAGIAAIRLFLENEAAPDRGW